MTWTVKTSRARGKPAEAAGKAPTAEHPTSQALAVRWAARSRLDATADDRETAALSDGVSLRGAVPLTWGMLRKVWREVAPVVCCHCAREAAFVSVRDAHPSYSTVSAIWQCVEPQCGTTMATPIDRQLIRSILVEAGARPVWRAPAPESE